MERLVSTFRDVRCEKLGAALKVCTNSVVLKHVKVTGLAAVVLWHTFEKTIKENC